MESGARSGMSLILDWPRADDDRARNNLIMMIYQELRNVVARLARRELSGHPLTPHAIVHDAAMCDDFAWALAVSVLKVERGRRTARAWLDEQRHDRRTQ